MKTLIIAAIAVLVALTGCAAPAPDTLAPCATEDSTACYWDAANRGNGLGHSFIVNTTK